MSGKAAASAEANAPDDRPIVIAGAGGYGREMADTVQTLGQIGSTTFAGFLDDDPETHASGLHYLGPIDAANVPDGCAVIISVGDPRVRLALSERLGDGVDYATVVHPTAVVSPSAVIGHGTFVAPFAYIGPGAVVGRHVALNIYAAVAHDARLADLCVVSPYANLNGHAVVGRGCFLGTGAAVTVGLEVGEWSKISMGAAVTRSLPPCSLASGVPATSRVMFKPPDTPDGHPGYTLSNQTAPTASLIESATPRRDPTAASTSSSFDPKAPANDETATE